MSPTETIFVDADGFVALAREDDSNHRKAVSQLDKLLDSQFNFITSNYVFAEVVTVLSQRLDHKSALAFIHQIRSPTSEYETVWVDKYIEQKGIDIFFRQTSKNTSFVDCTNMAIMLQNKIKRIFSFDKVYRKNGFQIVTETN